MAPRNYVLIRIVDPQTTGQHWRRYALKAGGTVANDSTDDLKRVLIAKRTELRERLERINANLRRGLAADSAERAKELEDSDVVDALGNEARQELADIDVALERLDADQYDVCAQCGGAIAASRLRAYPYASTCIDCAELAEKCERLRV